MTLAQQIMALSSAYAGDNNNERLAYKLGHRDARQAAAELVQSAEAELNDQLVSIAGQIVSLMSRRKCDTCGSPAEFRSTSIVSGKAAGDMHLCASCTAKSAGIKAPTPDPASKE